MVNCVSVSATTQHNEAPVPCKNGIYPEIVDKILNFLITILTVLLSENFVAGVRYLAHNYESDG